MQIQDFLNQTINNGIVAAKRDYKRESQKDKLEGSIAGFEACRDKSPKELLELLQVAAIATQDAFNMDDERYWWYRCYESEVEWVCNCISAIMMNEGLNPITTPTARGVLAAAKTVGIKSKKGI